MLVVCVLICLWVWFDRFELTLGLLDSDLLVSFTLYGLFLGCYILFCGYLVLGFEFMNLFVER